MAESKTVEPTQKYKHKPNKRVGYIKMQLLDDLCKETTNEQVEKVINPESTAYQ